MFPHVLVLTDATCSLQLDTKCLFYFIFFNHTLFYFHNCTKTLHINTLWFWLQGHTVDLLAENTMCMRCHLDTIKTL